MTTGENEIKSNFETPNDVESGYESQLKAARNFNNTWEFEGKEYEKFVATGMQSIETEIRNPKDNSIIGTLIHNFMWEDERAFVQRNKDLSFVSFSSGRSDSQQQEPVDRVSADSNLYRAIVVSGVLKTPHPKAGEKVPRTSMNQETVEYFPDFIEVSKTREEMVEYALRYEESAAQAIMLFENAFVCEVYFSEDVNAADLLFSKRDEVQLLGRIGSRENPLRLMLFTLDMASPNKRKEQLKNVRKIESKSVGDKMQNSYSERLDSKMVYVKRLTSSIQGLSVQTPGVDFEVTNKEEFFKKFPPLWTQQIHDKYVESFGDITRGKLETT